MSLSHPSRYSELRVLTGRRRRRSLTLLGQRVEVMPPMSVWKSLRLCRAVRVALSCELGVYRVP